MASGQAFGAVLLSSNGMDVYYDSDNSTVTYNVIGGDIELYVFSGPTPLSVVEQYAAVIGLPYLQPYWALGFHQCRYGYPSLDYIEQVRPALSTLTAAGRRKLLQRQHSAGSHLVRHRLHGAALPRLSLQPRHIPAGARPTVRRAPPPVPSPSAHSKLTS
jgi:hypothetical protein